MSEPRTWASVHKEWLGDGSLMNGYTKRGLSYATGEMAWNASRAALLAESPDVEGLVDRFLNWPLPDSVCSDDCASIVGYQGRSGTNLLTADETKQMLDHVVAPTLLSQQARIRELEGEIATAHTLLRRAERRGPIGMKLLGDIQSFLSNYPKDGA